MCEQVYTSDSISGCKIHRRKCMYIVRALCIGPVNNRSWHKKFRLSCRVASIYIYIYRNISLSRAACAGAASLSLCASYSIYTVTIRRASVCVLAFANAPPPPLPLRSGIRLSRTATLSDVPPCHSLLCFTYTSRISTRTSRITHTKPQNVCF